MEPNNKLGAIVAVIFMAAVAIIGAVCGAGAAAALLLR